MYYETVKTPSKCSHNLWIIKVNKKPEITLPAVHCIHVIKFQLESLLSTHHIFSYFDFHSLFPVKKKSNRSFSCKAPRLAFSFLPPVRFQIFTAGFSSRIFIFPPVHWLKKSDYSSLGVTMHFLSSRGQKVKNITKIEQKILFLFIFLVSFLWRFSRKNWFTQYIYDLTLCLAHFSKKNHLLNLFISGVYAKRWPKYARISIEKLM